MDKPLPSSFLRLTQSAAYLYDQILSVVSKLLDSPKRALPLGAWLFYNWFVFLSNVAPGPNALSLDPATWKEVRGFHVKNQSISHVPLA